VNGKINGILIDQELAKTNIVFFNITRGEMTPEQLTGKLAHKA